jgi:glycopeptide antibiotics resistance protein
VIPPRRALDAAIAAAAAVVALLTLLPTGRGWSWGAPVSEARWYVTGWDSTTAMVQLTGNLVLLAPLAVLAVLRWPGLASPARLATAAVAAGVGIELLQWALPLGRVVSPLDALLNATGGLVTGLVVARLRLGPASH